MRRWGWLSLDQKRMDWKPEVDTAPLYLQVAHHLESRISDGEFPVGSLLPTENEIAAALGVSRHMARRTACGCKDQRPARGIPGQPVKGGSRQRVRRGDPPAPSSPGKNKNGKSGQNTHQ